MKVNLAVIFWLIFAVIFVIGFAIKSNQEDIQKCEINHSHSTCIEWFK